MKTLLVALSVVFAVGCSAAAPDDASEGTTEDDLTVAPPLGPSPSGKPTRYPIVLAHGLFSAASGPVGFHAEIEKALVRDGHRVFRAASVPPVASVEVRAKALAADVDAVLRRTGAAKVNIVAHSMGGLDARALVAGLGYGDRVASVTTIGSPHRGSKIADVALGVGEGHGDALDGLLRLMPPPSGTERDDVSLRAALTDLSVARSEAFNRAHPNDPRVYYQSWAGVSRFAGLPWPEARAACEGRFLSFRSRVDQLDASLAGVAPFVGTAVNDGMVTVESSKWGNFRGCVPADHSDQVGSLAFAFTLYSAWTGFDAVRFNRNIAFDLAARGF